MYDAPQSSKKVALLFFDIDGFKAVNDEYGHDAGDLILIKIAERILPLISENDTAARIGGDEIVVVLSEITNKESARVIAQTLIDEVAKPYSYLDQNIYITASVGISLFPDNATNAKMLRKKADAAMYTVKKADKNGIAFA
jgi:diguanylate cyclase (GGDEF)-like protein